MKAETASGCVQVCSVVWHGGDMFQGEERRTLPL